MKNISKVLLVEDDALVSRVYEKAFRFGGYKITLAVNGKDALEKLGKELPDIIVSDLMMPIMSGIEFLKRVKKDPATHNIPVIILTNLAGEHDAEFSLSKGAAKYMVKSNQDPQEVVKAVAKILSEVVQAPAKVSVVETPASAAEDSAIDSMTAK